MRELVTRLSACVFANRPRVVIHACLAALFLIASSSGLFAQATATVNGRVVDQGQAVLPGVTITITSTATGIARPSVTNA